MRLTPVALTFFWVLFCVGFADGHILTTIRMTFPRSASNSCGVDVFLSFVLRWLCWWSHINNYSDVFSLFVRLFICLVACLFVCLILFSFVSFLVSLLFDDRCSSKCQNIDEYFDKSRQFYQCLCVLLKPTTFGVSFPEAIMIANVFTSQKHQILWLLYKTDKQNCGV